MGHLTEIAGWGGFPRQWHEINSINWSHPPSWENFAHRGVKVLPFGQGRSYGDSCLNGGGASLQTRFLDRLISFDESNGVLEVEAGVTLSQILHVFVPRGWFLPVCPGTGSVSVGGAIANDVHGKNHHRAGTFGCFVRELKLSRSDGSLRTCSESNHPELFRATIAGLGLTGLILSAKIQLKRVSSAWIDSETMIFRSLDEFMQLSSSSAPNWEYTVGWIDGSRPETFLNSRERRGVFYRGNHSPLAEFGPPQRRKISLPIHFPAWTVNSLSSRIMSDFYFGIASRKVGVRRVGYESFFFPLDRVLHWNRAYGRRGFLQYQMVVKESEAIATIDSLLSEFGKAKLYSPLAVLKVFGAMKSPGLLSFPRPGVTFTIDLPNTGPELLRVLDRCDAIVRSSGGALYPAKDARMNRETFVRSFLELEKFRIELDPAFSSSFWRRVSQ